MFYHCRDLKYVEYGKIDGFVSDDDSHIPAYRWLSFYCGYYPQVWLSRSSSIITGKMVRENGVLFGFDYVVGGFNIDSEQWFRALPGLLDNPGVIGDLKQRMKDHFIESNIQDDKDKTDEVDRMFPVRDYEDWRDNYLFVENDQVVVPRLNLKSAKEVICRNEKQKRKLRKMGFIEDRIQIRNFKKN